MTPGARMEAAIELLGLIWAGNDPADRVGDEYFRKRRYAGSGDRRAVNERVYAILRHRARLDWWIERTGLGAVPGPHRTEPCPQGFRQIVISGNHVAKQSVAPVLGHLQGV